MSSGVGGNSSPPLSSSPPSVEMGSPHEGGVVSVEEFQYLQRQLLELKATNYALEDRCVRLQQDSIPISGTAGKFFTRFNSMKTTFRNRDESPPTPPLISRAGSCSRQLQQAKEEAVLEAESLRVQMQSVREAYNQLRESTKSAKRGDTAEVQEQLMRTLRSKLPEKHNSLSSPKSEPCDGVAEVTAAPIDWDELCYEIRNFFLTVSDHSPSESDVKRRPSISPKSPLAATPLRIQRPSLILDINHIDCTKPAQETHKQLLSKIQQQQMELETLRETIDRQTQQINQLTMQVTDFKLENENKGQHRNALAVKEKVLVKQVELLEQRLEEQSETSRQAYQLRCAIQDLLQRQKLCDRNRTELREGLLEAKSSAGYHQEELKEAIRQNAALQEQLRQQRATLDLFALPLVPASENDTNWSSSEASCNDVALSPCFAPSPASESASCKPLQNENGSNEQQTKRLEEFELEIEELRIALKISERKTQHELKDLRDLLRQERKLKLQAEAECQRLLAEALESHINYYPTSSPELSDEEEGYRKNTDRLHPHSSSSTTAAGRNDNNNHRLHDNNNVFQISHMRKLQKNMEILQTRLAQTESENDEVRRELQMLYESEAALRMDLTTKTELITHLLKRYGLTHADDEVLPPQQRKTRNLFSTTSDSSGNLSTEQSAQLLEDAHLENLRLRNDLNTLGCDFKRLLSEKQDGSPFSNVPTSSRKNEQDDVVHFAAPGTQTNAR